MDRQAHMSSYVIIIESHDIIPLFLPPPLSLDPPGLTSMQPHPASSVYEYGSMALNPLRYVSHGMDR